MTHESKAAALPLEQQHKYAQTVIAAQVAPYRIRSAGVFFSHKDYGTRLLFKSGVTNPRDKLGKNGVTFHSWFGSWFRSTITITLDVIDKNGEATQQTLYINRNSLIKYLGTEVAHNLNDKSLIKLLNQRLYKTEYDHPSPQEREQQQRSGHLGLRHAGSYHQARISGGPQDRTIARFFSWLYQVTIGSLFGIKARLFLFGSEKSLLSTAESLAGHRALEARRLVPAYQAHLSEVKETPNTLADFPVTSKANYIKPHPPVTTHIRGKYPARYKVDTSTGTTGPATSWVRSHNEVDTVRKSLQLAARIQFGSRNVHYINAFAFGPWATGMTTYELMRSTENSSVFAAGPDKEKILEDILRVKQSEETQRQLGYEVNEPSQIVIAGYPPFLKELREYITSQGHDFAELNLIGVVGGQAISEAMRDILIRDGFKAVYSSYGASDLDINLGAEADWEITVRKALEQKPALGRELYGVNRGLPMVFHYDPWNYHVECTNENDLIFTCTRDDRSSPRIRYNLGDKGRVYASSAVQALLAKHGIFQKPRTNLPIMLVWGRESTVTFNAANLAFTELERAVEVVDEDQNILKKCFYTHDDRETGEQKLEFWFELKDGVALSAEQRAACARQVVAEISKRNQDFRYQYENLAQDAHVLTVRFFSRGHSPISEAGGHRKQVLCFTGTNLPQNFQYPDESHCQAIEIKKTQHKSTQAHVENLAGMRPLSLQPQ